jgi:hypothetical protein
MNYTKILIKQDGAYALPEIRLAVIEKTAKYDFDRLTKQAYQQALDNAVKFREKYPTYIIVLGLIEPSFKTELQKEHWYNRIDKTMIDGRTFDCPSDFEIVIENGYATLKNIKQRKITHESIVADCIKEVPLKDENQDKTHQ